MNTSFRFLESHEASVRLGELIFKDRSPDGDWETLSLEEKQLLQNEAIDVHNALKRFLSRLDLSSKVTQNTLVDAIHQESSRRLKESTTSVSELDEVTRQAHLRKIKLVFDNFN